MLYSLNVIFNNCNNKNYEMSKETRKYSPYTSKTVTKEAQMLDLQDKDFESAILNMFNELKEAMSKE